MAEVKTGQELGTKLCEILGLPVDRVQGITITAEAHGQAKVEVSRLVTEEEAQAIYTLFEYYDLVKKGEHKQVHPQGFMSNDVPENTDDWSKRCKTALEQAEEG